MQIDGKQYPKGQNIEIRISTVLQKRNEKKDLFGGNFCCTLNSSYHADNGHVQLFCNQRLSVSYQLQIQKCLENKLTFFKLGELIKKGFGLIYWWGIVLECSVKVSKCNQLQDRIVILPLHS